MHEYLKKKKLDMERLQRQLYQDLDHSIQEKSKLELRVNKSDEEIRKLNVEIVSERRGRKYIYIF